MRPKSWRKSPALQLEPLEAREVPAVYTVNGLADAVTPDGELTLREAISLNTGAITFGSLSSFEKAQVTGTVGTNDKIQFAHGGTVVLSGDLPAVSKKLTVEGLGAANLTVHGNFKYRPFTVAASGDLTVTGLRVYGGASATSGGAALNNGKLTASQVDFDTNKAGDHGGAIENNGTLVADQSYFHDNAAQKVGGAIDNNATATITNSTFANNTAGNNGGAVWSSGTLALTNCTITNNHAVNFGGGLRVTSGTTKLTSCTVVGNDADSDGTTFETGGGISNDGSTLTLNNAVVAQNTRNKKTVKSDIGGAASGQSNFVGVSADLTGITHGTNNSRVGTAAAPLDPLLGPLTNNGGFTPTLLPAAGSPLIGTGGPLALAGSTDQRGVARTEGKTTVGAVEVPVSPPPVSPPPVSPPPAPTVDLFAVGAGQGGGPHVRVYNADGTQRFSFYAYDPGYTGGVNVATGDVTGDGIDDIVTGTMAGGGPHVKVFDGATGAEVRSFMAYDEGFHGGLRLAVGDVNGDGRADIVTGVGSGGGPHVQVFDGKTGLSVRSFMAYDEGFRGGVNVGIGDVNGDGHPDIVTGVGSGGGPHVQVFDGQTNAVFKSFMAYDPGFTGGVNVAVGDVNGDGKADIITGVGSGGGPHVQVRSGKDDTTLGSFFAYPQDFTGGVRVATADLNGDGKADLLVSPGPGLKTTVKGLTATGGDLFAFDAYDPAFQGGVFVG